jgi:hypothetical protein
MKLKFHPFDWIYDKGKWKDSAKGKLKATTKLALKTINDKKYSATFHGQEVEVIEVSVGIDGQGEVFVLFGDESAPTGAPKRQPKQKTIILKNSAAMTTKKTPTINKNPTIKKAPTTNKARRPG